MHAYVQLLLPRVSGSLNSHQHAHPQASPFLLWPLEGPSAQKLLGASAVSQECCGHFPPLVLSLCHAPKVTICPGSGLPAAGSTIARILSRREENASPPARPHLPIWALKPGGALPASCEGLPENGPYFQSFSSAPLGPWGCPAPALSAHVPLVPWSCVLSAPVCERVEEHSVGEARSPHLLRRRRWIDRKLASPVAGCRHGGEEERGPYIPCSSDSVLQTLNEAHGTWWLGCRL